MAKKKNKHEIIEKALAGGLIGAALGALLTKRSQGAVSAALVGAAIGASLAAMKEAREKQLAFVYEEDGALYREYPDGTREYIRDIEKSDTKVPSTFSLD